MKPSGHSETLSSVQLQPENWLGLRDSHLEVVEAGHQLHPQAKQAWLAMEQAALADGLQLNLVSTYRNFERQQFIWDSKFNGKRPVLNDADEVVELTRLSAEEKVKAIMRFSALPGSSRHHWGTDLDVFSKPLQGELPLQLVASEYQAGGPQFVLSQWLQANAETFGFFFPYQLDLGGVACEPWHLSYRPVAEVIEKQRQPELILQAICNAHVAGQDIIEAHFDTLYQRFIEPICRGNQNGC